MLRPQASGSAVRNQVEVRIDITREGNEPGDRAVRRNTMEASSSKNCAFDYCSQACILPKPQANCCNPSASSHRLDGAMPRKTTDISVFVMGECSAGCTFESCLRKTDSDGK